MRRLASQVDQRRHPRTAAMVDQLLDRHLELVSAEADPRKPAEAGASSKRSRDVTRSVTRTRVDWCGLCLLQWSRPTASSLVGAW